MNDTRVPSRDALIAQLKEVNERSRTYTRQFWQMPFAYVAGGGVVLGQVADDESFAFRIALITAGAIGFFVVGYLWLLLGPILRAFDAIRDVEERLDLPSTATKWTAGHLHVFLALTGVTTLGALVAGLYLVLCR